MNRPELDVKSVLGAGAGNANIDGSDELKRDGDEACLNTEGDDDEVVKRLGEVERGKVDEVIGIDEVLEPLKLKDGICGANIFDGVEVLKRLEDVRANVGAGFKMFEVDKGKQLPPAGTCPPLSPN